MVLSILVGLQIVYISASQFPARSACEIYRRRFIFKEEFRKFRGCLCLKERPFSENQSPSSSEIMKRCTLTSKPRRFFEVTSEFNFFYRKASKPSLSLFHILSLHAMTFSTFETKKFDCVLTNACFFSFLVSILRG